MYTNFRAFLSNIHVGCCLFSHDLTPTKSHNIIVLWFALLLFLLCDSSILQSLYKRAKRKKMRSTHTCTPTFAPFFPNIHVGCCLFSHNDIQNTTYKYQWCDESPSLLSSNFLLLQFLSHLHSCATQRKKCGAHTHVHQLSLIFFSIFTSVVVYSRTTQKSRQIQKFSGVSYDHR